MLTIPTPAELKAMRLRLGLTQSQVAKEAGVSQSLVARIEGGGVDPRYSTFSSILAALNRIEGTTSTVSEVMNREVATVTSDKPLGVAVKLMREQAFSQLPIVDGAVPVGSLSEKDVIKALAGRTREAFDALVVSDLMRPPFPAVSPDEPVDTARRHLEDHGAVLVMDHGEVLGIVTKSDLLRALG